MQNIRSSILFVLSFFLLNSCGGVSVGNLTATVSPPGDATGDNSTAANVNFTSFKSPDTGDGRLHLNFSNPEGDTMAFAITPKSDTDLFPVASYPIDGSENTFHASFTVGTASGTKTYDVTTTDGFINLLNVQIENNVLIGIKAEFKVNFDIGGLGEGSIHYSKH